MRLTRSERVLARVENYPFEIDLLLADSGFYNERVIRRARDIAPTVVHVPKKGERMKDKLETHKSYMTTYRMCTRTASGNCASRSRSLSPTRTEIEGKHGEVVRGYVACGVTDRSAKQVEHRYRKRSGIERPIAYFGKHAGSRRRVIPSCGLPSCWSRHCWRTCGWCYGGRSSPAHGGRARPARRSSRSRRSVTGFVKSWKRSRRRWKIKANGVGVPASQGNGRGLTGPAHGLSVGGERQLSADTVKSG